jgi:hypothetical protein
VLQPYTVARGSTGAAFLPACDVQRERHSSERKALMPGKFVVKKGPTGKFRFSLLSTNGQVVASSEAYRRSAQR